MKDAVLLSNLFSYNLYITSAKIVISWHKSKYIQEIPSFFHYFLIVFCVKCEYMVTLGEEEGTIICDKHHLSRKKAKALFNCSICTLQSYKALIRQ